MRQEPADVDPDLWTDEGELTELPDIPVGDGDGVLPVTSMDPVNPEVIATPDLDIPMIFDSPEEREMRKGIHERIQAEIYHEERERAFQAEERLDAPPGWNDVEDLIMNDREILAENMKPEKRRSNEVARGRRKRRKEDDICAEKREHSPSTSKRTRNPEGFYSENWNDDKQEEDKWQVPDKFQRISQMVFCNGVLESHPVGDKVLSSHRVQHQGGGCSIFHART